MFAPHLRSLAFEFLALACLGLVGCATVRDTSSKVTEAVQPYKIDIIQGNVVTREQLAVLKPGMARAQVRDVLGTALLTSVFHENRWDYVFTFKRSGVAPQSRRVVVFFKDDLVDRIEADDLPSEAEFVDTLKSNAKIDKLPPLVASQEALTKFPTPEPVVPAATAAAPTNYPPLEPAGK